MQRVLLANIGVPANDIKEDEFTHEGTGNKLKRYEIHFDVVGHKVKEIIEETLEKKVLPFMVADSDDSIRVRVTNKYYSYEGQLQNDQTCYSFCVHLEQVDSTLPEEWNYQQVLIQEIALNRLRIRTLLELLEEKGVLTKEEFEEKAGIVFSRDYKNLANYINYGIPEPEPDPNQD